MSSGIWKKTKVDLCASSKPTHEELRRVQALQESIYSENTIKVEELMNALKKINREHFDEVALERAAGGVCGLPICGDAVSGQRSRISGGVIFSDELVGNFCSTKCYKMYSKCKESISLVPFHLREPEAKEVVENVIIREVKAPELQKEQ